MIRYAVFALALTVASAAPASQQSATMQKQQDALARTLAGLNPGKPVSCISQRGIDNVQAYGNVLVYSHGRAQKWRNDTGGGCSHMGQDVMVSRSTMPEYCSGDIIETHDQSTGMPTGSCSLGEFVPYGK